MAKIGFIQNIKTWAHKKTVANFVKRTEKELSAFEEIEICIPDNVTKALAREKNEKAYLEKKVDNLQKRTEEHNFRVKNINACKSSFSYRNIISDPYLISSDTLFFYKEVLEAFGDYPSLNKEDSFFRDSLRNVVNDISEIRVQYSALTKEKELLSFDHQEYLDYFGEEKAKEKIREVLKPITEAPKAYYETVSFSEITKKIEENNRLFIENNIPDPVFLDVCGRNLDEEQRKAILTNSISHLTIAGAGCGKTTTICGKVKYLLAKGMAKPKDILLLSFSRNSEVDLKNKVSQINQGLEVRTFHSLGLEILSSVNKKKYAVEDQFDALIERYFREVLPTDSRMSSLVLSFYGLFMQYEPGLFFGNKGKQFEELKKQDLRTLQDETEERSAPTLQTFQKENVKSLEELAIANFYFLNGIRYEYEAPYCHDTSSSERRQYLPDFYLLDYKIYHEHYGINEEGKTPQYDSEEEKEYLESMKWKRDLHFRYGTICLETYSYEFKDGHIFEDLEKQLSGHNVVLHPIRPERASETINSIYQGKKFKGFISLLKSFLCLYKAKYTNYEGFAELKKKARGLGDSYSVKRVEMFLDICKGVYGYYNRVLEKENKIDFDYMINEAARVLPSTTGFRYSYILVDEFQDISYSRAQFLKALIAHSDAHLFAVGDDWQAIYRFAGCDLNYFLNFKSEFQDAKVDFLGNTHRNSQDIQDIMEPFIEKNPDQIRKHLMSAKRKENPIRIAYYSSSNRSLILTKVLGSIHQENPHASVLLLARNNYDIVPYMDERRIKLRDCSIVERKYPGLKISFKTIHGSKGLESDYVVVLNNSDGPYGFPNTIEDDPILSLILCKEDNFPDAEERRLFYVAVTRTKNITYLLAPEEAPSVFLQEIRPSALELNSPKEEDKSISCPRCHGGHLVFRKNENQGFYGCSNYPYCRYTNKDISAVRKNKRCPVCGDFLVLRRNSKGHPFWGCSNFPRCHYTEEYTFRKTMITLWKFLKRR